MRIPYLNSSNSLAPRFRIGSLTLAILALIVLVYLATIFFAPQAIVKPDDTWTQIQQSHVLRIGVDPSSPPFVSDDGKGNLSGFEVALANEMAQQWGVKIQYVYTGFDGLYDALTGKQFDMILSALPYNPDKTQDVYFSHSYFNAGPVLIVRGDDTQTSGLASLNGLVIGVELGSNGDSAARKWLRRYNYTIQEYNTAGAALGALQKNLINATIVDPIAFYDFQRANADAGAKNWRTAGEPLNDESYVIAVRRDSPTVLQNVNAVIDSLKGNGKLIEFEQENF